ncbi:nucleotidyltransferase domain-containing protein [Candidatus Undinarchaeota archaeon]
MDKDYTAEVERYIRLYIDSFTKHHGKVLPKDTYSIITNTLKDTNLYPEINQFIESGELSDDEIRNSIVKKAIGKIAVTKQGALSRPKYSDKKVLGNIYLILESTLSSVRRDRSFREHEKEKGKYSFSSEADAKKYLRDFAEKVVETGGDNVEAILLFGSLSKYGSYAPGKSDIDLVFISKDSLPQQPGCYKHCKVHDLVQEKENYNFDTEYSDACISFCYRGFKDFLSQHTDLIIRALDKEDWKEATELQSNLYEFQILYAKDNATRRKIDIFTKNLVDIVEEKVQENLDKVLKNLGYD